MKKIVLITFAAFILFSCVTEKQRQKILATCPQKEIIKEVKKDSISYIVRDSMVMNPMDSSLIEMLMKCDSMGRITLEELRQKDGKQIKTKIIFKDNVLKINAYKDSISVLHKIISKYVKTASDSLNKSHTTAVINKCDIWYHYASMWLNLVLICVILVFIVLYKLAHI